MEAARYEALVRLPAEESVRDSFPKGLPEPIEVPARRYTHPAFLELERTHVFESSWLFVPTPTRSRTRATT